MSRFFVSNDAISKEKIYITSKEDIAHISRVLRMKVGDIIDISDSCNWEYKCEISSIEDDQVVADIIDKQTFAREPETEIILFQGVPKQGKMEVIIQKNTELGIKKIIPVFMDRSVVKDNGKYHKKVERYNIIATAAAKQCRRGVVPDVGSAINFDELVGHLSGFDLVIFPYENEENYTIKDLLQDTLSNLGKPKTIAIIIGPEGGFSDEEAQKLSQEGIRGVSLGKTILRTETAGMTAVAMCMYELEL